MGGEQTSVRAGGGGGGTSGRGGGRRSEEEQATCSHSTSGRRLALSGQKDPREPGLDGPLGTTPSVPQRRPHRPLKALGSQSSVQEPKSQAGLLDMSCARPAPVVPTGPQYRMVRRAGDPLKGSVPSYDLRCPPTPGAQPARGGGAGGIPTVHEVEQPAVRRVQIVRGHAVPVRGPVDAAVVLHVELLQACGTSAPTCWALGPGLCPHPRSAPRQTLMNTASPSPSQGASRLTGPIAQHSCPLLPAPTPPPLGSHSGTRGGATLWGRHARSALPGGGSGPAGPPRHSAGCCSSRPWAGTPADSGTRLWRDVRASSQETAWGQSMLVGSRLTVTARGHPR